MVFFIVDQVLVRDLGIKGKYIYVKYKISFKLKII